MDAARLFDDGDIAIAPEVAVAVGNLDRTALVDFLAGLLTTWWENTNGANATKAERKEFVTISHETLARATKVGM